MIQQNRQAGETANRYHLSVEDLRDNPVYANGDVLKDANWKAARFRGLQNINEHDAEDLVQDWLLKVWKKRGEYDPAKGASLRTYAKGIIDGMSLNDNRRIKAQRHREGVSIDELVRGDSSSGVRGSAPTLALSDASELMPANYRGARQIRTSCDLDLIHEMMGETDDWKIFILRWRYRLTNEELAEELDWTIGKLRHHLKGYERRWARLLGVRRSR